MRAALLSSFCIGAVAVVTSGFSHAGPIFNTAAPVAELNSTASDSVTWISADGLMVVLTSNRPGTFDLYSATRVSIGGAFSTPTTSPFTTANNATFNSASGVLSSNGLELFYHE